MLDLLRLLFKTVIFKILILTAVCLSAYNLVFVYLKTPGPLEQPIALIVKPGMSQDEIVELLSQNNVIQYPEVFKIITKFYGLKYNLKSGEYLFTSAITPEQIFTILTIGKSIVRKMLIPEGFTVQQILDKLYEEKRLDGEIHGELIEGYLLPDTYYFSYNDKRQMLINQMKKGMSEALDKLMPEIENSQTPIKTRLDVLKLASIIERETNQDSEKSRVAAVYINRLKKGMKLQADPTTIYGITNGKTLLGRSLKKSDLLQVNLHNTYMINGLPATAICCPGVKALEAAVRPMITNDIFFVANGRGGHNFSQTHEQHKMKVIEYRKGLTK